MTIPRRLRTIPRTRATRRTHPRARRAFTLIEASLTTVIVGTGVLAIVAAQQGYHRLNNQAVNQGSAQLLANEIRELTLTLPLTDPQYGITLGGGVEPGEDQADIRTYDDLDDFAGPVSGGLGQGVTFRPPVNALKETIPDLGDRWSQFVIVENKAEDYINDPFTSYPLGSTDAVRVSVQVRQHDDENDPTGRVVYEMSWVVNQ
ncbi:MAG: hypothetical protein AAGA57_02190 [Planctomycetota bacterium]